MTTPTATTPLLDSSDEQTRLTLKRLRLQVLTPLAVLVNVAVFLTCGLLVSKCAMIGLDTSNPKQRSGHLLDPSISDLSRAFPTAVTPHTGMISMLWFTIFLGQIGYCILLVMAGMHHTQVRKLLVRRDKRPHLYLRICLSPVWASAWFSPTG